MTEAEQAQFSAAADKAQRAIYAHNLAMQAFNVAVARFDFKLAQKEQDMALASLSENMDAIQALHRIRASL
jgi:hypothetical protein